MKPKGLAEVIVAGPAMKKKAPAAPPSSSGELEEGPSEEEVSAFSELQAAMKSGDPRMGAQALKNFIKECGGY